MQTAFKTFMSRIVDYAGVFPPAKLPMESAIQNYLGYKNGSDEWMLSRFICPATRLKELDKYQAQFKSFEKILSFSFLGKGGKRTDEFLMGLKEDLDLVKEFKEYHGDKIKVDAYEVRFPAEIIKKHDLESTTNFLNQIAKIIESYAQDEVTPFYEGAFSGDWEQTIKALIQGISEHNKFFANKRTTKYRLAGYKLRCGGAETSMYPTPEQVAYVIHRCNRYQIPLKTTAGLHHPLRHFNQAEQVKMHGFLNVFSAGILAEYHELSVEEIKDIIEDENVANFAFTLNGFKWGDFSATPDQIKAARSQRMISFGSCSFDEPREDLQKLGYL